MGYGIRDMGYSEADFQSADLFPVTGYRLLDTGVKVKYSPDIF